ncbi:glutamate formimidoyltransferase [bacterium]|nr:glutamate formimidoyltransferase [candidate division CSSED10-310 bacterium]
MERIVECVPNFSEGKNKATIETISRSISQISGVELLDVDPGADTNRTVVTFVGNPDAAAEAAFRAIETASKLIDMSKHHGAHPRMGATDVCPFIPVSGLSIEDCIELARKLGRRVGDELGIPVYLYEYAASVADRRNLADIRKGEYEGLPEKLIDPEWKPDFGPSRFNPQTGATVIGVRKFLIAYNVNLNTRSRRLAHNIALDIREKGRWLKDDDGKIMKKDGSGKIRKEGLLKECKAVGWYIDEYDRAQVSINLTDYDITPPHLAFDTCVRVAQQYGLRVTGSELVGLIPREAVLRAGRHYLACQGMSTGIPEKMIVDTAIQSMGLNEITPFNPREKIIEYRIAKSESSKLVGMTCRDFVDELSTDSPAPGGGSVAALCGSLGAALSAMVANLTVEKKGFETIRETMIKTADSAQALKDEFLRDVDRDTSAFNDLMTCFGLPKSTSEQREHRDAAIEKATRSAIMVPLNVLNRTLDVMNLTKTVARNGNPNSISDSGVSALAALAAGEGAYYNVIINLENVRDESYADEIRSQADAARFQLHTRAAEISEIVTGKLKIKPIRMSP